MAREKFPELSYEVGSMTALDRPEGSLAGILAFYSIIHLPPQRRPEVFAEFRRVLGAGGWLLLGFQVGEEPVLVERPLGHGVSVDFQRLHPERLAESLADAGFEVRASLVREPEEGERTQHAHALARAR
nr:class I SAM-dependent methyltransferase [Prauserella cavernicola]